MPSRNWNNAWDEWYRRAFPAYCVFLFFGTHLPQLELDLPVSSSDKIAHTTAFGLLAFLLWRFAESFRRPPSAWLVWMTGIGLLLYAGLDEFLQQFVGRSTDFADWLCDAAGIATALALLEWRRRAKLHSGPAANRDKARAA